jgi:hypothetical protein
VLNRAAITPELVALISDPANHVVLFPLPDAKVAVVLGFNIYVCVDHAQRGQHKQSGSNVTFQGAFFAIVSMPVRHFAGHRLRRWIVRCLGACPTRAVFLGHRRRTHFLAIPLLATPAAACAVNDAGATSAAARVFSHGYSWGCAKAVQTMVSKLFKAA